MNNRKEVPPMNVAGHRVPTNVRLSTGDRAHVLEINASGDTVRVRYLDALGQLEQVDTEAWIPWSMRSSPSIREPTSRALRNLAHTP